MSEVIELAHLKGQDLERDDLRFTDGTYTYATSGKQLGRGGMGAAWLVTRWRGEDPGQIVVVKTYREEYLIALAEDAVARRHFDHFEHVVQEVRALEHPNILPVLKVAPISDNYILVTPLAGPSLLSTLAAGTLAPKERVHLLIDALRGLAAMHARGIVHRDFTLHNVLTVGDRAVVFDFDISVAPYLLPDEERTYRAYYRGRILGSPEFSIAPELLDDVLAREAISPRVDVYAAGTALWALFTEESLYGEVPDLPSLFDRIADGMVHRRQSRIQLNAAVPPSLWPILEACLEREPEQRFADASELLLALETAVENLSDAEARGPYRKTQGYDVTQVSWSPEELYESRLDPSVTLAEISRMELTMARHGYLVESSLGRVKGHAIYLVMPDPELVGAGQFPDDNTYRKIVTAIDLSKRENPEAFVQTWLGRYFPIIQGVRSGFLTALYKVVHDRETQQLLLYSEYVADPRFGTDLADLTLTLEEVFGLGLIVALSIGRLHDQGIAHNNVEAKSLVFKGLREAGRVLPLFVGLVEPSSTVEARLADVRQLAKMIGALIKQSRIDALRPDLRPEIMRTREELEAIQAGGQNKAPSIHVLTYLFSKALGIIEPNFELVRTHEGDVGAFADLLVRHSLYNKLYMLDVSDD